MKDTRTIFLCLLFCLVACTNIFGQVVANQIKHCDCPEAQKVTVQRSSIVQSTADTPGGGKVSEINNKVGIPPVFENEHNSYWYLLDFTFESEVEFTIIPKSPNDDYDFVLYSYSDTSFCAKVRSQLLQPLRSNIARTQFVGQGKTGLSHSAKENFVDRGPGSPFSASIHVKKGEKYMLVVDNINPKGQGHSIRFTTVSNYQVATHIVTSPFQKPTKITILNNSGDTILNSKTTSAGKLDTTLWLSDYEPYSAWFDSDSCLGNVLAFTPKIYSKNSKISFKDTLRKISPNCPLLLNNVYFKTGSAELDSNSHTPLKRVVSLMNKYPNMKVQINGHVNGDSVTMAADTKGFQQKLSLDRAQTVKDYLVSCGIPSDRISVKGFGAKNPVIPNARTPEAMRKNMRVEIEVISY